MYGRYGEQLLKGTEFLFGVMKIDCGDIAQLCEKI